MTANSSALFCYAMIISVQKLTQVIKLNTAGFLRIQRHKRKILKIILKRPLKQTGIDQKRFHDQYQSRHMKCHCSLLADLKNEDKIGRTFLKGEQILLLLTKFQKKIGRKLITSYSNKMQPQLMLQKCNRIFLLVPRKSESHLKSTQKQAKSITEVDEPKTSSLVKPRS